jgi:hypothetical protein
MPWTISSITSAGGSTWSTTTVADFKRVGGEGHALGRTVEARKREARGPSGSLARCMRGQKGLFDGQPIPRSRAGTHSEIESEVRVQGPQSRSIVRVHVMA